LNASDDGYLEDPHKVAGRCVVLPQNAVALTVIAPEAREGRRPIVVYAELVKSITQWPSKTLRTELNDRPEDK
jgi:hypothetical protein